MHKYNRIRPLLHHPCWRLAPLKYNKGTTAVANHQHERASAPSIRNRIYTWEY